MGYLSEIQNKRASIGEISPLRSRVLNSPAGPLPAALLGAKIPLPEVRPNQTHIADVQRVFGAGSTDRATRRTPQGYARGGVCFARNAATRAFAEVRAAPVFHSGMNSQFGINFDSSSEIG